MGALDDLWSGRKAAKEPDADPKLENLARDLDRAQRAERDALARLRTADAEREQLADQLAGVTAERDALREQLAAAGGGGGAPPEPPPEPPAAGAAPPAAG